MKFNHLTCFTAAVIVLLATETPSQAATTHGGIVFPAGDVSFADSVIRYLPLYSGGPGPTNPIAQNPTKALGPPDFVSASNTGFVSLGNGGLLELRFIDNLLSNSGNSAHDLYIFEVGPEVEATSVSIRPTTETAALLGVSHDINSDGFYEIGSVSGATASIDIDSFFSGFAPGTLLFDAVQLVDFYNPADVAAAFLGADIDAVGAIYTVPVPEPSGALLAGFAGIFAIFRRRRAA